MLAKMYNIIRTGIYVSGVLLLFSACFTLTAAAEVTATPSVLVFHNTGQSETVTLLSEGEPLSAQTVASWRLLVDDRNYSHMLRVTATDAGLRVSPSDTAEIGSYVLALTTARGTATVQVFTPLTDHQSSIEALAQRMGVAIEDVRKQMGLTQRLGREQITMNLLPVYYVGQHIQVEMSGAENREPVWKVNGETVQRGADAWRFSYVAEEPGPLLIVYQEYENDVVIALDSVLVEAVNQPAIPHEVAVGARAHFNAPPGFAEHVWRVDDVETASGVAFHHTFSQPGRYSVRVMSTEPTKAGPYAFRETRYEVTAASN